MDIQSASTINQKNNHSHFYLKILLIIFVLLGFITTFISGFIIAKLLSSENAVLPSTKTKNIPHPTSNNSQVVQDTTKFLPGKYYFDDTVIVVTKDKPQISLVASVTRAEQDKDYAQISRVSYYDGSNWTRQTDSKTTQDSAIVGDTLVKNWGTSIDPSRVLKQTAQGEITINNASLIFSTGVLQNEIGIRSLPGYTKFISNGTGTISINGKEHPAYILYTRIYSFNAADIQYYNQSFGLTTDWIAFWDTKGNFYHIDATDVNKPTAIYQTHQIGIMEDINGSVTKTFDVNVTRNAKNPPSNYTVLLKSPLAETLHLTRVNGINKAPDGSYTWYMGNIEGTVQTAAGEKINGVGLLEYIHN